MMSNFLYKSHTFSGKLNRFHVITETLHYAHFLCKLGYEKIENYLPDYYPEVILASSNSHPQLV